MSTRTSTPRSTTSRSTATDVALIAGFAALIAVCAILPALNVGTPVPVTLQTFAVLLSGAVLGMRRGFLAVVLYLAVGAAGLPVFSGGAAGLAVFSGPSVGYLVGFPFAAALCGFVVERLPRRTVQTSVPVIFAAGLVSSALFIHTAGMTGLVLRVPTDWAGAWDIDKFFWPGDVLKNVAMALVATAVHRAFPDLLDRRRGVPADRGETVTA